MNSQIEQAIKYRDNYRDFLAALPAFIYNNNIEIFQANLEQMDQEIDHMIEEADDLHAKNADDLAQIVNGTSSPAWWDAQQERSL